MLSIVCGFSLVLPLSIKIVYFTFANLHNANNVGYPQPGWLFPSDILGLSTIYANYKLYIAEQAHVIGRGLIYLILCILLSIWVVYELLKQRKHSLLLVALIGGLGFFIYNKMLHPYPPTNYLYDKLVMLFAAVVICYFFKSLQENQRNYIGYAIVFFFLSTVWFLGGNLQYRGAVNIRDMKEIVSQYENKKIAWGI